MTEHGMLTLSKLHTQWHKVESVPSHLIYFLLSQLTSALLSIHLLFVSLLLSQKPSSKAQHLTDLFHFPVFPFWLHPTTLSFLCPSKDSPSLTKCFASHLSATQTPNIEIFRCRRSENITDWFKDTVWMWSLKEISWRRQSGETFH